MSDIPSEIKQWGLEASEWLWGTVQGAWNEKQTTSQIVVDAAVGMIPLVGDATAARDLIAVSTGLIQNPQKREETMQWVLLVVLVFALIPVIGGVIKGVGRIAIREGIELMGHSAVLREMVEFLNRIGHGDAVKFIRELDVTLYKAQIVAKFNEFCDKMVSVFQGIKDKLGWFVSSAMKERIDGWIAGFKKLKELGEKKIPDALKELHVKLKRYQEALYSGEWHEVQSGTRNLTREAEARTKDFYESMKFKRKPGPYPQNASDSRASIDAVYHPQPGYPELDKWPSDIPGGLGKKTDVGVGSTSKGSYYTDISCFSGPIVPKEIKGPTTLNRVIGIGKRGEVKPNNPAGAFWVEGAKPPASAERWRHDLAVLDTFNHNGYVVYLDVPSGMTLKSWEGVAAEQFGENGKQYLKGGATQLYIDLGLDRKVTQEMGKAFEHGATSFTAPNGMVFRLQDSGWKDANGIHGFGQDAIDGTTHSERLAKSEYEEKRSQALGAATSTRVERGTQPDKDKK